MDKHNHKLKYIFCLATSVLFGAAAIVLIALAVIYRNTGMLTGLVVGAVFAGLMFAAFLFICVEFSIRHKRLLQNLSRSDSFASLISKKGSGYTHFTAVPEVTPHAEENAERGGKAEYMMLSGGIFSLAKAELDIYVSADELLINSSKNPTLDDDKFLRIRANEVADVMFQTSGNRERMMISLVNGGYPICFDVQGSDSKTVRTAFKGFTSPSRFASHTELTRLCPVCGTKIGANCTYCFNCGCNIDETEANQEAETEI